MMHDLSHLPKGWRRLAQEFLDRVTREFRGAVVTEISAKAGWLSVDIDKNSVRPQDYWRASKTCESVGSASWHVCVECGSHHAEPRPGHVMPICTPCLT